MKLFVTLRHLYLRPVAVAILSLLALSAFLPATAFAASPSSSPTATPRCAPTETQCIINLGDQLIATRQTALTNLNSKVTGDLNKQLITGDEAAVLQSDISTNQQGLSALQTKLNAETNAQAARQDVVNIFWQFRIYVVVLPRDYRQLYLDIARTLDTKLRGFGPQVQQAIEKAPINEQPQLQSLFSDYQAQLTTAEGQFDAAATDVIALTPSNYNYTRASYENTLASLNASLKTIRSALHQAGQDLHQIAGILKDK